MYPEKSIRDHAIASYLVLSIVIDTLYSQSDRQIVNCVVNVCIGLRVPGRRSEDQEPSEQMRQSCSPHQSSQPYRANWNAPDEQPEGSYLHLKRTLCETVASFSIN